MKKIYFIGLCLIALASCSTTNDDLQNFDKVNLNQSASGGFRDGGGFNEDPSSKGIWVQNTRPPYPIYGFYSSSLKRHVYSSLSIAELAPHWLSGPHNYFYDRYLGSADGNGQILTAWYNENSEDMIITTNPDEIKGAWKKYQDFGRTYNGDEPGSFPIYRYFRSKYNSHFYTRDFNELGNGRDGFVYEGIAFYLKESSSPDVRIRDGQFYQDNNTGFYYIVFESQLRHIESIETIRRVFDFKGDSRGNGKPKEYLINKVNIDDLKGERGLPIISSAVIYQDVDNGIMYFSDPKSSGRGGSNLKRIPNPTVFERYRFNTDFIIKTRGINNPRISDVEITY
ncbi:hypothetical protein BAS09_08495 [Elizabethkingia ursingii]|uniref:hypothetical protein n=1 Tax=Elizabethkingia ursingii TaxID=1756150 RepID=UPI000999577F|nr:hypothetical protein [Elizabethkingia ursingii]MCL1672100.1 hypothetical protein [Elizabethkingia ursingii]OPC03703.1 hypothetical protein BAS09_08495 [Elizabethkingia ursingii]